MDPQLRRDPKYQNFLTVTRGFAYVGKVLEPYTVAGLKRAHQNAYLICAGLPPCLQQCSRAYGRITQRWCATCKAWKNALLHDRKKPYYNWENTESWNWSTSYDNITSVFLPSLWNPTDIKFNEIGTACHLWTSCREFNINHTLLTKVRELRNKHYGHNPDLKIENVEKTTVFDTLKTLVQAQDVQGHLNVGQCIQDLDAIAKGDELKECMDDIEARLDSISLKMGSNDATQKIFAVCVEVCFSKMMRQIELQNQKLDAITVIITSVCILMLAIVISEIPSVVKRHYNIGTVMYQQYTECFSETYSHPFPQDLHLLPYFKEHSTFFGRTWLFEDIEKFTVEDGLSEKGILITADIGYGKSAVVKHMLCSHKDEKAYKIRSQIVAFHLCRFDVPSTKNPQRFIYRLVGFLYTHIPEYGALVELLPETSLLFDGEKCRKEIIACFDQGVLHPLLEMKTIDRGKHIIVIDALDECYDKRIHENMLLDLLIARYKQFPKWIQFIITSRNTSIIQYLHHLKHFSLNSSDHRNKADIKQYIEYKASLHPALLNFEGGLDIFLNQSEGLFLFVVHLVECATTKQNGKTFEFPESLSAVYEMNFERHFHSVADYEIARTILEIVIASLHPLSNIEVAKILDTLNVSNKETVKGNFERIKFCFRSFQELTFIHQTLHVWLISSNNNIRFNVSVERGHAMLSRYLLSQTNSTRADIVDIAIHIGNANDTTLEKAFSGIYSNKNVTESTLHKLVWKSDSTRALKLLLNLQIDVDTLNEGNVTPSFVAAAKGHLKQLKFLQSRGADLNFRVNDLYLITSPAQQIDMIKHDYYFGYKLIHIAAQFGHYETVYFLLKQNKTLRHDANGLGLTLAEIVCENGHYKLLELVLKSKDDVGNCLYYAAKNKHVHIVNRLVQLGVNASCVSHTDAIHASSKLRTVNYTKSIFTLNSDIIPHSFLNLDDLWWVVYQESPLHAAIKSKSEETAIALIKHYPHLADCVDAFGMTPFLVSVTEDLTNVFEVLVERVKTDTCQNASTLLKAQPYYSDVPMCPVGGTYVHLDGIYGRLDLTKIIYQKDITIDWLVPDSNSISAAHYAACNENLLFLEFFNWYVKQAWSDIRSDNRSTPYHSAAICGSPGAFYVMTDAFKTYPPELYDIENKTLLHYLVMREFTGNPAHVDDHEQVKSGIFLEILLKSGINIRISDSFMRNILHYAIKNGHYHIIKYLYHDANVSFNELIKQRDIHGNSPVEYALKSETSWKFDISILKMPSKCMYYDIFFTYCETGGLLNQYLSSWELGLYMTLEAATVDVASDFSNAFKAILIKSPYLTAAMLVYMKDNIHLRHLRKQFIDSIPYSPPFASVLAIARHVPKLFTVCGKLLSESPLHQMAYKYKSAVSIADMDFLLLAFRHPTNLYALSCADSRGYNSFHYALMGGDIDLAIRLFNAGVSITNKNVSIKDITWMMLLAKKNSLSFIHNSGCYDQLSCMDHLLKLFYLKYVDNILYSDFCKSSTDLSLVHIVAASGMENAMNTLNEKFGNIIFECKNKDRISPMYLWDLFNNNSSSKTFKISTKIINKPFVDTEELLLLGLLNDFPFGVFDDSPLRCLLSKHRPTKRKSINCFQSFRFKTGITKTTYLYLYKIANICLNSILTAQNSFENALYFKPGIMKEAVEDVRFWAGAFYKFVRAIKVSFNYPRLKQLLSDQLPITNCEQNEPMQYRLHCIQLAKELSHMIDRVISYTNKEFIYEYVSALKRMSLIVTSDNEFLKHRMEILSTAQNPSSVFESDEFVFSRMYDGIFERHRYLNILKKTVKYQQVKEKNRLSVYSMFYSQSVNTKYKVEVTTNIPRPFDDILQYVNTSTYSHVLDSFQ